MLLTTLALTAAMAGQPTTRCDAKLQTPAKIAVTQFVAIELHSMTEEEKQAFPGRERFDKTEWYESCFKSVRTVITPEHVDEWKNGGRDLS